MPHALSGGQCQRVAIARALVNRPRLLLADEPTASLDKDSAMKVVQLFQQLVAEDGCSIMMVTHDNRVLDAADRIVNMVHGRIVSDVFIREAAMLCEFLAGVTGFESQGASALTGIAERMKPRRMRVGDALVRQGEIGLELFVIRSGKVDVLVTDGRGTRKVADLGQGDFFGERADHRGAAHSDGHGERGRHRLHARQGILRGGARFEPDLQGAGAGGIFSAPVSTGGAAARRQPYFDAKNLSGRPAGSKYVPARRSHTVK
jgi:energy-coupling factor transporter ATP-binding protein EcfA2